MTTSQEGLDSMELGFKDSRLKTCTNEDLIIMKISRVWNHSYSRNILDRGLEIFEYLHRNFHYNETS